MWTRTLVFLSLPHVGVEAKMQRRGQFHWAASYMQMTHRYSYAGTNMSKRVELCLTDEFTIKFRRGRR